MASRDRRRVDVRIFVGCQNTGKIRRSDSRRVSKYGQNTTLGFSSDVKIRAKYGVRIYVGFQLYGQNTTLGFSSDVKLRAEYDVRILV